MKSEKRKSYDFPKDLQTRGCPACNAVWQVISDFWASWINKLVEDEKTRLENAVAQGLCSFHSWQLVAMASPQGISKSYAPLMEFIAEKLYDLAYVQEVRASRIRALVKDPSECRICLLIKENEDLYLQHLSVYLCHENNRHLYAASQGVCLRHLGLILNYITDKDVEQFLLLASAKNFKSMAKSMQSYVSKRENLERHLHDTDEKDAYLRAVIHIAGARCLGISIQE